VDCEEVSMPPSTIRGNPEMSMPWAAYEEKWWYNVS
jgi:hypothetical protein